MLLSLFATLAAVLAALMLLANLAATGGYMNPAPQGADAMGIVLFLIFAVLIALALPFATLCLLGNGRLAAFALKPAWLCVLLALLIGVAVIGALMIWLEVHSARGLVSLFGLVCGALLPLLACTMLVIAAWREPPMLHEAPWWQWGQWSLLMGAAAGGGALLAGIAGTLRG